MNQELTSSRIANSTRRMSTGLASRISRRSFLGRAGKFALVIGGGGTAVGILADPALATLQCDTCHPTCTACSTSNRPDPGCTAPGSSVTCKGLTGTGGVCPNSTVTCGSWACNCSSCSSGSKRWTDCCETGTHCDGGARCVTDVDGETRPTCRFRKCYPSSQGTCSQYIRCRIGVCT